MMGRISSVLPWMLIGGGTFIIQWHSIAFWSEHVNPSIGWIWSIVIEAGSLWLWYRPGWSSRMLGLAASILLLAGPLYQIGGQAVKAETQVRAAAVHARMVRAQSAQAVRTAHARIAQDAQLMRTYARNSEKRTGWLPAIERLQKRMDEEQTRLETLTGRLATGADAPPESHKLVASKGVSVILLVLLQALGLALIQVTNILAITHISRKMRVRTISAPYAQECADNAHLCAEEAKKRDAWDEKEPVAPSTAQLSAHKVRTLCADLRGLAQDAREWMEREQISIAGASLKLGVSRQNLSCLVRWESPGDRKPSNEALEKIRAVMNHQQEIAL